MHEAVPLPINEGGVSFSPAATAGFNPPGVSVSGRVGILDRGCEEDAGRAAYADGALSAQLVSRLLQPGPGNRLRRARSTGTSVGG